MQALSLYEEGLRECLPVARQHNVILAIEPEPGLLIQHSHECLEFLARIAESFHGQLPFHDRTLGFGQGTTRHPGRRFAGGRDRLSGGTLLREDAGRLRGLADAVARRPRLAAVRSLAVVLCLIHDRGGVRADRRPEPESTGSQ